MDTTERSVVCTCKDDDVLKGDETDTAGTKQTHIVPFEIDINDFPSTDNGIELDRTNTLKDKRVTGSDNDKDVNNDDTPDNEPVDDKAKWDDIALDSVDNSLEITDKTDSSIDDGNDETVRGTDKHKPTEISGKLK